jgi:hypothetical protein
MKIYISNNITKYKKHEKKIKIINNKKIKNNIFKK